jgi:hypothetical protein
MHQKTLETLFNDIAVGQDLFHHRMDFLAPASKIIAWFGRWTFLNNVPRIAPVSHTSKIIQVHKEITEIGNNQDTTNYVKIFQLFEATVKNGVNIHPKFRRISKIETKINGKVNGKVNVTYKLDGFGKKENLYWANIKLTDEQKDLFLEFAKETIGAKYSVRKTLQTWKSRAGAILSSIGNIFGYTVTYNLPNYEKLTQEGKEEGIFCSALNKLSMGVIGFFSKEEFGDPKPDPMEYKRELIKKNVSILKIH